MLVFGYVPELRGFRERKCLDCLGEKLNKGQNVSNGELLFCDVACKEQDEEEYKFFLVSGCGGFDFEEEKLCEIADGDGHVAIR